MTHALSRIADLALPHRTGEESAHARQHRRGFALLYLLSLVWGVGIVTTFAMSQAPWFVVLDTVVAQALAVLIGVAMRRGMTMQRGAPWMTNVMLACYILPALYVGGILGPVVGWLILCPLLTLSMRRARAAVLQFPVVVLILTFLAGYQWVYGLPPQAFSASGMILLGWISAVVVAVFLLSLFLISDLSIQRRQSALMAINGNLQQEIEGHLATQAALHQVQAQLVDAARMAGKAEVATGALHNIGNALNGVSVSTATSRRLLERLKPERLLNLATLLDDNQDPRLSAYAGKLAQDMERIRQDALDELQRAIDAVDHVASVVAIQQADARYSGVAEPVDLSLAIAHARILFGMPTNIELELVVECDEPVLADRHRTLQILTNLLKNACDAVVNVTHPRITVTIRTQGNDAVVRVQDNGMGIPDALLSRIFAHGFTTKNSGSGFGLHASALAASEMGGSLEVESKGVGQGAAFTLRLPRGGSVDPETGE